MDSEDLELQYRFAPAWDAKVLNWCSPRYDSAFVLLHPFIKVPQELVQYIESDGNRWLEEDAIELLMEMGPKHVTWEEIRVALGRESLSHLLADINGNAVGFCPGATNENRVAKLVDYLRSNHLLAPETHYLPTTLKPKIKKSIVEFGEGNSKAKGFSGESPYVRRNLFYMTPYECPYSFIVSSISILESIVSEFGFDGFFADEFTAFGWQAKGGRHS